MANGNHRGIHKADATAFVKRRQLHKKHQMEECARHEFQESVIRHSRGKILCEMAFDLKEVVVLEINKQAKMVTHDNDYDFTFEQQSLEVFRTESKLENWQKVILFKRLHVSWLLWSLSVPISRMILYFLTR